MKYQSETVTRIDVYTQTLVTKVEEKEEERDK